MTLTRGEQSYSCPKIFKMKSKRIVSCLYDYNAQNEQEMTFIEGEMLLILNDLDEDWWDAVKKQDDAFSDQITGLVPATYVQDHVPLKSVVALYDYEASNDEELSFPEGATLEIHDDTDNEWWLATFDREVGLVPVNYLEVLVFNLGFFSCQVYS